MKYLFYIDASPPYLAWKWMSTPRACRADIIVEQEFLEKFGMEMANYLRKTPEEQQANPESPY
jgi:hypothetical protein